MEEIMKESDKKEIDKEYFKTFMLYMIVGGISEFFYFTISYTKSKFDLFMTLFPYTIYFIYMIKKIIYCKKEKKSFKLLIIYIIFLFFSFFTFCIRSKNLYEIYTSK